MRLQTQVEPEIQKRLLLSRVEAESLKERDILCPTCGFRIQRVFQPFLSLLSHGCNSVPRRGWLRDLFLQPFLLVFFG